MQEARRSYLVRLQARVSHRRDLHYRLHVIREACLFWRRELVAKDITLNLAVPGYRNYPALTVGECLTIMLPSYLKRATEFEQQVMDYSRIKTFNEQKILLQWLLEAETAVSTLLNIEVDSSLMRVAFPAYRQRRTRCAYSFMCDTRR
jgi:hypothetical protein